MGRRAGLVVCYVCTFLCTALVFAAPAPASAATTCSVKSIQKAAPKDTTIVSAERADKPVPHCKIEGYVTTADPGPNKNNFRLQLPEKGQWKGRFYFIGLGGAAGYVPTDSQIPNGNPMRQGFAVAGTDTGHQGPGADWSFMTDPAKRIDHIHRGAHVTTVAAQQITKAYYATEKLYRYHSGCSGGGRMGWEALRNHPEDYDGVLLGESGSRADPPVSGTMLKHVHAAQQMVREPGAWLSQAKLKMLDAKVTAACDMTDGAEDGVVWDYRLCKYDVAKLKCKKGDAEDCLTAPEIKSLKAILDGPRDPKGKLLSYPMPITNSPSWGYIIGPAPPPWTDDPSPENMRKSSGGYIFANTMAHGMIGPDFDTLRDIDFKTGKGVDTFENGFRDAGFGALMAQNLAPYEQHGGKLLMWGGVSSPCCSNRDLEDYVEKQTQALGAARRSGFIALYEIPGAGHCGGGTGPQDHSDQLLAALVDWVEQGKAPGPVVTHRGAERLKLAFADPAAPTVSGVGIPAPVGAPRDFLLCPYPQVSVFDKSKAKIQGAVFDAANWSCRASRD